MRLAGFFQSLTLDNRDKVFFTCDGGDNSFEASTGCVEGDFHERYVELEILGEVR